MSTTIDRSTLWTRMRFLIDALSTRPDSANFVDESLDLVSELLGADLAVICVRVPDRWNGIAARRRRRTVAVGDLDELRAELLDESLRLRRCLIKTIDDERNYPTTAVAVPLHRGAWRGAGRVARTLGALYLEVRSHDEQCIRPLHVEFLESVAVLLSMMLDQQARLEAAQEDLRAERVFDHIDEGPSLETIIAAESMADLRGDIRACVVGSSSAMILGETGTGKTRLAAAIAKASGRTPIVRATLGASDDLNTITSELFGHERGAFSGAVTSRKGLVEYASGGTLILDEILNLPPHAQQLLLDFTQFGTYRPLGYQGKEPKRSTLRIISATNGNILHAVTDTRFRQDLYFRLAGVTIALPPLRERRHEVPELAQRHLRRLDPARGWRLSAAARRLLLSDAWEWEGNIRQLQAVVQRARDRAIASEPTDDILDAHHIGNPPSLKERPLMRTPPPQENADVQAVCEETAPVEASWAELQVQRSSLDENERGIIDRAMRENRGVVSHAAKQLQVSRTSLLSRMATLHMDKKKYRS